MQNTPPLIPVFDVVMALAFVGDLSMGQPTDHSVRTAWLARRLGEAAGLSSVHLDTAQESALLRWSGCTANAAGFSKLLGDDVAGRDAMLTMRPDRLAPFEPGGPGENAAAPLARIHCEVSGELARILDLGKETEETLRQIFERFDGKGVPDGIRPECISPAVFIVNLAGDLEIFSRTYGLEHACSLISGKAGAQYPVNLAALTSRLAGDLLRALDREPVSAAQASLLTDHMAHYTALELVADVIDLKLPWMTGFSRKVAKAAARCCIGLGMDTFAQNSVYQAGLIHGIGRASVPNNIWIMPGTLTASAWEKVRLVPYWTSRVGQQITSLSSEAEIASYGYERLDGSGYFRGSSSTAIPRLAQILGVAIMWEALKSQRPWRPPFTIAQAATHLRNESERGRVDKEIVEQMVSPISHSDGPQRKGSDQILSPRETDVLREISLGASNKSVARSLGLSPSTVGTHVESVFRKLDCSTRAAAILKASMLGLL